MYQNINQEKNNYSGSKVLEEKEILKVPNIKVNQKTEFEEIENEITETEKVISRMIDELEGSESDMLGLKELKKLLGGIQNDERKW